MRKKCEINGRRNEIKKRVREVKVDKFKKEKIWIFIILIGNKERGERDLEKRKVRMEKMEWMREKKGKRENI